MSPTECAGAGLRAEASLGCVMAPRTDLVLLATNHRVDIERERPPRRGASLFDVGAGRAGVGLEFHAEQLAPLLAGDPQRLVHRAEGNAVRHPPELVPVGVNAVQEDPRLDRAGVRVDRSHAHRGDDVAPDEVRGRALGPVGARPREHFIELTPAQKLLRGGRRAADPMRHGGVRHHARDELELVDAHDVRHVVGAVVHGDAVLDGEAGARPAQRVQHGGAVPGHEGGVVQGGGQTPAFAHPGVEVQRLDLLEGVLVHDVHGAGLPREGDQLVVPEGDALPKVARGQLCAAAQGELGLAEVHVEDAHEGLVVEPGALQERAVAVAEDEALGERGGVVRKLLHHAQVEHRGRLRRRARPARRARGQRGSGGQRPARPHGRAAYVLGTTLRTYVRTYACVCIRRYVPSYVTVRTHERGAQSAALLLLRLLLRFLLHLLL
eukprot:CAMPEP_0202117422 /NCGR_PEP_ID=MMETSP0965-20130614/42638_1 /ASSEMBLY_ACC=CAM_ASM_000507 /TAXON_ID=4773 /ORGANISM="Schizochytrium aggregatum, Strain ATCC28209" /LENGTH=436 /DNA_ID=CAMNT_0048687339 /DNA_START=585 /DNA_END=1892 /DNA_ORIENTATION=+